MRFAIFNSTVSRFCPMKITNYPNFSEDVQVENVSALNRLEFFWFNTFFYTQLSEELVKVVQLARHNG